MSPPGSDDIWADAPEDLAVFTAMVDALAPVTPSAGGRAGLFAAVGDPASTPTVSTSRLHRFAAGIGRMIDVGVVHATALIDRTATALWEPGPVAGCETLWVEGGASAAGAIRGFVRLAAGTAFPHHHHLGDEQVLILQGAMRDESGAVHGPGTLLTKPQGSSHGFEAAAGGPDLLYFTMVYEGVRVGDRILRHRDPGAG